MEVRKCLRTTAEDLLVSYVNTIDHWSRAIVNLLVAVNLVQPTVTLLLMVAVNHELQKP